MVKYKHFFWLFAFNVGLACADFFVTLYNKPISVIVESNILFLIAPSFWLMALTNGLVFWYVWYQYHKSDISDSYQFYYTSLLCSIIPFRLFAIWNGWKIITYVSEKAIQANITQTEVIQGVVEQIGNVPAPDLAASYFSTMGVYSLIPLTVCVIAYWIHKKETLDAKK